MRWRRFANPKDLPLSPALSPGTGRGSCLLALLTLLLLNSSLARIDPVYITGEGPDSRTLLLLGAIVFSLVVLIISVLTKKYRPLWIALASIAAIAALLYFRS